MKYIGFALIALVLSACGTGFMGTKYTEYCLQEHEANGYDYMVVAEKHVCDRSTYDVEWYEAPVGLNIGDLAYVEADGGHTTRNKKSSSTTRPVTSYPAYDRNFNKSVPNPPKICPKAHYKPAAPAPKPAPPAPKPPAPAPVKPQPVPTVPKAPTQAPAQPVPTIKPGC